MKEYRNRNELKEDINLINHVTQRFKGQFINELITLWKETSPDSPYFINIPQMNHGVQKILENGISNQWKGEHIIFEEVKG